MNPDIGRLPGYTADRRLVDKNARIWQCKPLTGGSCGEKQCSHRCALTDADRGNIGTDELHRVVYSHTCGYRPARAVDIQRDVAVGVLSLEKKKLSHNQIRYCVVDRCADEDDVVF